MLTIAPESITVIPNAKGKPAGVLIDMDTWNSILEALELAEDLPVIKQALSALKSAGGIQSKQDSFPGPQRVQN
ncbi:MAG: hypothetical protein LC138_09035 [Anaerolineales bacterium]|nr:hypothetical protein [Anaerolineales bacterium]